MGSWVAPQVVARLPERMGWPEQARADAAVELL
jgi:hypothetical protein